MVIDHIRIEQIALRALGNDLSKFFLRNYSYFIINESNRFSRKQKIHYSHKELGTPHTNGHSKHNPP